MPNAYAMLWFDFLKQFKICFLLHSFIIFSLSFEGQLMPKCAIKFWLKRLIAQVHRILHRYTRYYTGTQDIYCTDTQITQVHRIFITQVHTILHRYTGYLLHRYTDYTGTQDITQVHKILHRYTRYCTGTQDIYYTDTRRPVMSFNLKSSFAFHLNIRWKIK